MSVESAPTSGALLEFSPELANRELGIDEQEAARIIHKLLEDIPPELIASFEPTAAESLFEATREGIEQTEMDEIMRTGFVERVQALTTERADLLVELQRYRTVTDERLAEAMEDPAIYLKDAMLAFARRCSGRIYAADTHRIGGTNVVQFSNYFATVKEPKQGDPQRHIVEPEIFMRIGFSYDSQEPKYRDEQGRPLGEPRFFEVRTAFRRDEHQQGSMYEFYVGPDNELKITEIYYRQGNYQQRRIEDKARSYQLFQALVMDMHYELEFYNEARDKDARAMAKWYVSNQIAVN